MGRLRVTEAKKSAGKKQLTPQETFAKLWKQVQNEQAQLGLLPDQIKSFYNQYLEACGPLEARSCNLQRAEIELLLKFWPRKGLREVDRIFMVKYILSTFNELNSSPFTDFPLDELQEKIRITLAPDEDEPDMDFDVFDKPAENETEDNHAFEQGDGDFFDEDDSAFEEFFRDHTEDAKRTQNDIASELFNASTLNKMFRQLSKVLHPDLEQDEEQKRLKHELMAKLLTAREKHDVGTIMSLYSQHIGGDGAQFLAEDFPKLTLLLKKQLREVQKEKKQLALQSGIEGLIYHRFHHKNPTRQKNTLRERMAYLEQMCAASDEFLAVNTSVKNIKKYLADWAEDQFDLIFFDGF